MSDSITKYFDEQWNPPQQKKINNSLTPLQAIDIINRLSLYVEDDDELLEDVALIKSWIKSR